MPLSVNIGGRAGRECRVDPATRVARRDPAARYTVTVVQLVPNDGKEMSVSPRRRFATVTSAVAAALVGVLLIATPAQAEGEVDVEIGDLSDSIRAGVMSFDTFRATVTNASNGVISGVFTVVSVSFPGAPAGTIHVQRVPGIDLPAASTGDGTATFTDATPFDLGRDGGSSRRRIDFFLGFSEGVPEGQASITVAAYTGGQLLGSASRSVEVRGGTGATTPANTDPGFVPTFTAGPTYSVAPLTEAADAGRSNATMPKSIYVLGSLLIIMGLVTLFLILRPPGRPLAESGAASGPGRRRPMVWPSGRADGPRSPRAQSPAALGSAGPQQWPAVGRPGPAPQPTLSPPPPQATPQHRAGPSRPGSHTGTGRAVRDPTPDDPRWYQD
jgi:hypothetical protein